MKKERIAVPLDKLQLNKGQIEWLPQNPRQWTDDSLERMIRSLEEDPDFMEDRPPLVVPLPAGKGKFVVFGGNERVEGEKRRGAIEALECYVYIPEDDNDRQTIIRRSAKDNGHYGAYDWDIYANEWADFPMEDWGAPSGFGKQVDIAGLFDETKKAGKEKEMTLTVVIPKDMEDKAEDIRASLELTLEDFPGVKVK